MNNKQKIAIYSGEIPSTTFIERLIAGLAEKQQAIFIFGKKKQFVKYPQFVSVIGYKNNRWSKGIHLSKYSFLLYLFKNKEKRKLDMLLQNQKKNSLNDKLKAYPVLYHRPDVFHIQWAKSIKDWAWVQSFGMKLVVSLRGTHITISPKASNEWKQTYLNFFSRIDGFHSVSETLAIEVLKYGVNRQSVHIIKSGVDIKMLNYLEKSALSKPLQILSIGRSHFAKGYKYALDTVNILKSKSIQFHYTIVGITMDEALLFQRNQLGLESCVSLKKNLPFADIIKAIQRADVLMLPSVEEGIANVVLEAMALGTLVVSTNCGGMAEVILPNETGFLVPIRDPHKMSETLEEVAQMSISDYQRITKQARLFIEKNHNDQQMVSKMIKFYKKVNAEKL